MPIWGAVIGLVICAVGAVLFFREAYRKKQKIFIFAGALFAIAALLSGIYLALAAIFLTGGAFTR